MEDQSKLPVSKGYLLMILLLMLVLPGACVLIELFRNWLLSITDIVGKWFIFWAVGVRLLSAGFKQALDPAFTAKGIFHIHDKESFVVVKELGFANICFGLTGILSLFFPAWRMAAACSGGLYIGIAGVNHIIKRPVSANEWVAMISDLFIGAVMVGYMVAEWRR